MKDPIISHNTSPQGKQLHHGPSYSLVNSKAPPHASEKRERIEARENGGAWTVRNSDME